MTLYYRPRRSPKENKDGEFLWHPTLAKAGVVVDTQKIAKKISQRTTAHPGDVHNIIRSLTEVMSEELLNGHSVRLDGLGTFTLYIRSRGNGVDSADKVNPSQINSLICKFTPEYHRPVFGGTTRAMYEGVEFKHVNQRVSNTGTDEGGGGNDFIDPTE